MSWPDLHCLMPEDPFRPGLTITESYDIRARNVANNPHIVSSYLSTRHQHLRDTVLQHLGINDGCGVVDFWFRIQWQSRGSGAPISASDVLHLLIRIFRPHPWIPVAHKRCPSRRR